MNERDLVDALCTVLEESELVNECFEEAGGEEGAELSVCTFEQDGVMTSNQGLVLRFGDSEFQLTVVRSR